MSSSSASITYEPSGCNCDGTSYTKAAINAAATKALQLASEGQTLDPHVYNDYENFNFSQAQKPYLEFPVEQSGVYDGQSPGADRVVIGSISEDYSSAVFCAVITHDGSSHNGFTECTDDTMNVRGKGTYENESGQQSRHHGHHGKKLLDRIDLKN